MNLIDPDKLTLPQLVQAYKELAQNYSELQQKCTQTIDAERLKYSALAAEHEKLKLAQSPEPPNAPCWGSQPRIKMRTDPS